MADVEVDPSGEFVPAPDPPVWDHDLEGDEPSAKRRIATLYLPLDLGAVGRLLQAFGEAWPDASAVADPEDSQILHIEAEA